MVWFCFSSGCCSGPHRIRLPSKSNKDPKAKDQKEGLYDLKIGSWQNRVDQDLEATRKQIAEMDLKQQEIRDQFKGIGDALSELSLQMKEERDRDVQQLNPPIPEQKAPGNGITVMRFGVTKSSVTERPRKPELKFLISNKSLIFPAARWRVRFC